MLLEISSKIRDYEVIFEENYNFMSDIMNIENSVLIIDKNVYKLYKDKFQKIQPEKLYLFDAIEENKTFEYVKNIYEFLINLSVKRNLTIISVGGGITQDITGFVASTLYRGVKWIYIPTTFLAMTDSCIGSKTSINFDKYKNLMGSFYPPDKIFINTDFLNTLDRLNFYSGLGETIKFQLMKEEYPKDFSGILQKINQVINDTSYRLEIIHESMSIKCGYMLDDEFDLGKRNLLNYGHCFGHALETSSGYYVPHGIAVIVGMIFANLLSVQRNLLKKSDAIFVNEKILLPNVILKMRAVDFQSTNILNAMKNDKKRIGKFLTVIIPNVHFEMIKIDDISDKEFEYTISSLKKLYFK